VAAHAALARVAGGARRGQTLRVLAVRAKEVRRSMTWRRLQRPGVRWRSLVHRQCGDHRRFGGVDVTRYAEVLRVAGGAGRRHGHGPGRGRSPRRLAVCTEREVGCLVRLRFREIRDVLARQRRRRRHRYVTGRARLARHVHMRRVEPVARDALVHDIALDVHSWRTALVMARRAILQERTVGGVPGSDRACVRFVREPKISGGQPHGPRLPRDARLDDAIVARGARRGAGKDGLPRLRDTRVARRAEREQPGMPRMPEPIFRRRSRSEHRSLESTRRLAAPRSHADGRGAQHADGEDHADARR